MERLTDAQWGYIENHIKNNFKNELADFAYTVNGKTINAPFIGLKHFLFEKISKQIASRVIGLMKDGNNLEGMQILKDHGLPTK